MSQIGEGSFMALKSFKKSGEGVITPVWVCELDGKLYVWTEARSWKVKRIRANSLVEIATSDAQGNAKSSWQAAQARVLEDPEWIERVKKGMIKKYGLQFYLIHLSQLFARQKSTRAAVEIIPNSN